MMPASIGTVESHEALEQCPQVATDCCIRHLPVLEEQRVLRLISIGDLVNVVIDGQRLQLRQWQDGIVWS